MDILDRNAFDDDKTIMEHANVGSRIGASLLDFLILSPLTIGLNFYNFISLKSLPIAIVIAIVAILYKPLFEWNREATIGKSLLGIKVTNHSYETMSLGQSFLRSFPFYVSTLVILPMTINMFSSNEFMDVTSFSDYMLFSANFMKDYSYANYGSWFSGIFTIGGLIAILANKDKMALHDMLAKTYVVKK
jgi:uncharacterized RDD family membrane protein YckC